MMDDSLMSMLMQITEEEQKILKGITGVEKELYTETKDFTIDSKKMLTRGRLMDIRAHTRFIHFPKHKHNYIEIIYMCSGETTHIINDSKKITLKVGDLLFLNQHAYHEIFPAKQEDIAVNFIVLQEFFDKAFHMIEKDNPIGNFLINSLRKDGTEVQYLHFKVSKILPVQNLIENMIWSIVNQQNNKSYINQITMGLLFLQLLNHTDTIDYHAHHQHDSALVMDCLHYIENNYKNGTLTELAQLLHQSVYTLSRLIKENTGSTFKELLQQKRFNQATQLLCETRLSVSDIISAVGYDNTSYFYRIFKERYELTPNQYRKKYSLERLQTRT